MASEIAKLYVELSANSAPFKTAMGEAGAAGEGFGGKIGGALAAVGKLGVGMAAVGVGVAAVSVDMAAHFETLTTQLVTGAGESQANLAMVRDGLLSMAGEVGATPAELAKGLFLIESAGYHGAAGLDVLKASAEGAAVGGADMETTANAVTTVMKDYASANVTATDATNFLVGVVSLGKTHMEDLASSMQSILPVASAYKINLQEVGGAMATLTSRGVPADQASRSLAFTMTALETSKAPDTLKAIGYNANELAGIMSQQGLIPAFQSLQDHLAHTYQVGSPEYNKALEQITGGMRGLRGALGLTGDSFAGFISNTEQITGKMNESKGAVMGWALVQDTLGHKLKDLDGSAQALAIRLGDMLLPAASSFASWLAGPGLTSLVGFGGWINTHILPTVQQLGHWFTQDGVPAIQSFSGWMNQNVVPTFISLAGAVGKFGTDFYNWVIVPAEHVVAVVAPPLLAFVRTLADNFSALEPWLIGIGGGFLLLKGAVMGEAALRGVGLAWSAVAAVLAGEVVPAEAAAALGAESLGAMIDTAMGPAGIAIAAIIGIGIVVANFTDLFGKHLSASEQESNQWAEITKQDTANAAAGWEEYQRKAHGAMQSVMADQVIAMAVAAGNKQQQQASDQGQQQFADFQKQWRITQADLQEARTHLTEDSTAVFSSIADNGPEIDKFYKAWRQNNYDTDLTIQQLASNGDATMAAMMGSMESSVATKWGQVVNTFGAGSTQANAAMEAMTPSQRNIIGQLQAMSATGVSSFDQIVNAANGSGQAFVRVNGQTVPLHGSLDQMISQYQGLINQAPKLGPALTPPPSAAAGLQGLANIASGLLGTFQHLTGLDLGGIFAVLSGKVPGHATGTLGFHGGLTMVGELGPELVSLPQGSQITANSQLASGRDMGGGGQTVVIQVGDINITESKNARDTAIQTRQALLDLARGSGVTSLFGVNA